MCSSDRFDSSRKARASRLHCSRCLRIPESEGVVNCACPLGCGAETIGTSYRGLTGQVSVNASPRLSMASLYRILPLLIAAALIVGCAQSPTRPAPERLQGDASESDDRTRASDPERDLAVGEATVEPVAEPTAEKAKRALTIRIGSQSFVYAEGDHVVRTGRISSGRDGYGTPRGTFSVLSKQKDKVSSRYTNQVGMQAWMPYSIQFYGHYFLHEGWLPGYPDSHGCVRVGEKDARFLFGRMKIGDLVSVVD
jgi:hypothetical protein